MIDMHSHIVAQVDDGPSSIEEAMQMVKQAVAEGITGIIATPHAYHPSYHASKSAVEKGVTVLKQRIEEAGLSIAIYTGQEIRLQDKTVENLERKEALSLAASNYVLVELPSSQVPTFTIPLIQKLMGQGFIPIIAHPERNKAIAEKPARLERLVTNGALAQVTAGSVAGHFGKATQRTAMTLIRSNLVHFYGSDAHNLTTRPFLFSQGLDTLDKSHLHDYVDLFLENNARIVEKKAAILLEPQVIEEKKWWSLFSKV